MEDLTDVTREGLMALVGEQLRGSPAVHADKTHWREDGRNGYVWSFSTPSVRYLLYRQSRGSQVVTEVLGETFEGMLGSDLCSAYTVHLGEH